MKENYTLLDGCTYLYTTQTDPCLQAWETSGHQNVYAFGPALFTIMANSISNITQPDLFTYWLPGYFQGFFHGFAQKLADTHNALTAVVLKAHPSSRGSVTLTGSDPQAPLHIEKRHFEAAGGQGDINSIITGMRSAWDLANNVNISKHVEARVFPDASVVTDQQIENHILQNVFGAFGQHYSISASDQPLSAIRSSRLLHEQDGCRLWYVYMSFVNMVDF